MAEKKVNGLINSEDSKTVSVYPTKTTSSTNQSGNSQTHSQSQDYIEFIKSFPEKKYNKISYSQFGIQETTCPATDVKNNYKDYADINEKRIYSNGDDSYKKYIYKIKRKKQTIFYVKSHVIKIVGNWKDDPKVREMLDMIIREYKITNDFSIISNYCIKVIDFKIEVINNDSCICAEMLFEYGGISIDKAIDSLMITNQDLFIIFYQLASAFNIMEEAEIAHLDIKPQNIICNDKKIKIIDFGNAISYDDYPKKNENQIIFDIEKFHQGTKGLEPPEVIQYFSLNDLSQREKYAKIINPQKVDCYCFAITLAKLLLCRDYNFYVDENIDIYKESLDQLKTSIDNTIKKFDEKLCGITTIILQCLDYFPNNRPSFADIQKSLREILIKNSEISYNIEAIDKENSRIVNVNEICEIHKKCSSNRAVLFFLKKITKSFDLSKLDNSIEMCEYFNAFNKAGMIYRNMRDNIKAIEAFETALEVLKRIQKVYSKDMQKELIELNCQMIIINSEIGNIKKYEELYKYAMKIIEKSPERLIFENKLKESYGVALFNREKYVESIEVLNSVLNFKLNYQHVANDSTLLAALYENIGCAYLNLGNYDKALENYKIARNIYEKNSGKNYDKLIICYNNIGLCLYKKDKLTESSECYLNSITICKINFGENHPFLVSTYINFGTSYYNEYLNNVSDLSKLDNAENYYKEAIKIAIKINPEKNEFLAKAYNGLGKVLICRAKKSKKDMRYAKELLKKGIQYHADAIKIFANLHKPLSIAKIYKTLAEGYEYTYNYEKAIDCYKKIVKIYEGFYKKEEEKIEKNKKLHDIYTCIISICEKWKNRKRDVSDIQRKTDEIKKIYAIELEKIGPITDPKK